MRSLFYALAALLIALLVAADTEIRNFKLPLASSPRALSSIRKGSPRLLPSIPQTLEVSSASPEQTLVLAFPDDAREGSSWTVRISWPGSSPTKWEVDLAPLVNSPGSAVLYLTASPLSPRVPAVDWAGIRRCIPPQLAFLDSFLDWLLPNQSSVPPSGAGAKGRASQTCNISALPLLGRLFGHLNFIPGLPSFGAESRHNLDAASKKWEKEAWQTTFSLVLEPLYFGVLPRSSLPALGFISVFALGAWALVSFVIGTLEAHANIIDEKVWEAEEKAFGEGK